MLTAYIFSPIAELIFLFIFLGLFIAAEEFDWSCGFFLTCAVVLFAYFAPNPWGINVDWILDHKITSVAVILAYFVLGGFYSMFKWWRFLANKVIYFKEMGNNAVQIANKLPVASANKSRLMWWIGYWPLSFVWTLLSDPFTKACQAVYNQLGKTYDKIRAQVIANLV